MTATRIDVHAHYLGGALQRAQPPEATNPAGTPIPQDWTADGAIEFMDRHDFAAQILSFPHTFTADGDPESAG